MEYGKLELARVAYTEETIPMSGFLDLIETVECLLFTDGIYKNGPVTVETKLSAFGHSKEATLFKVYIPVNAPIEEDEHFQYLERFVIEQALFEVRPFSEQMFEAIDQMKEELKASNLDIVDDTLYLEVFPIYGKLFVELSIPYKEAE